MTYAAMEVPSTDGTGTLLDVSDLDFEKNINIIGGFTGFLYVEASHNDNQWAPVAFAQGASDAAIALSVDGIFKSLRVRREKVSGGAPPMVHFGGSVASAASQSFQQAGSSTVRSLQTKARGVYSLNDFLPTGAADDWRTALVDALAELGNSKGGKIELERSSAKYDFDNTRLGPILWADDSIGLEGASILSASIRNVSTDGTDFINYAGPVGSVNRGYIRNVKIESLITAGDIFGFVDSATPPYDENGVSFHRWENFWFIQRNPDKHIMYGRFQDDVVGQGGGGCFESQWVNGVLEHGSGTSNNLPIVAATVPAIDLEATVSLIVLYSWEHVRAQCHGSLVPFWSLACTDDAPGNKKYIHQCTWRDINVEIPRRGIIRLKGHASGIIEGITTYDLGLNGLVAGIDGHLVEVISGPSTLGNGGRASQHNRITKFQRNGAGHLRGVSGTDVAGTFVAAGTTVTVSAVAHGREVGQRIYTTGDIAGRFTVVTVPDVDHLTFEMSAPPAAGNITVYEGALDIKLGPDNEGDEIIGCNALGGSDQMEADVNYTNARVDGHMSGRATNGLTVYRQNPTIAAYTELGHTDDETTSRFLINEVSADKLTPLPGALFIDWSFKNDFDGLDLSIGTATTIKIGPGRCRDDSDSQIDNTLGDITINLAIAGANGIDDGVLQADKVYDAYRIWAADRSKVQKGLAVLSGAVPVMPADYDRKRRVGSFATYTNGVNIEIIPFVQRGTGRQREIMYTGASEAMLTALANGHSIGGANVSLAKWVPTNSKLARLLVGYVGTVAGNRMLVISPITGSIADWCHLVCQVAGIEVRQQMQMIMSNALNVKYQVQLVGDGAYIYVLGYNDSL